MALGIPPIMLKVMDLFRSLPVATVHIVLDRRARLDAGLVSRCSVPANSVTYSVGQRPYAPSSR